MNDAHAPDAPSADYFLGLPSWKFLTEFNPRVEEAMKRRSQIEVSRCVERREQIFRERREQAKPPLRVVQAGDEKPAPPVDILREFAAPAYEERDVPEVIGRYAAEFARAGGFDPSMIMLAVVTSAAAILDERIRIRQPSATLWTESARIWGAIVAPSAAGKSPAVKAATQPIVSLHSDHFRQWLAENEGIKEEERTPRPALFSSDMTIEALANVLKANERGIIVLPDEFDAWLGQHDAYRANGVSRDRGEWLRLYDGGPHQIDRVKRGSSLIPNWGASILTTTTPTALRRQRRKLHADGLLQRFIVAMARPMSAPQEATTMTMGLRRDAYGACLKRLHAFDPGGLVEYTDAAATIFEEEVAQLRQLATACLGWSEGLSSHVGKHPGMLARLTLTFHALADDTHPAERLVAPETVRLAMRFMRKAFRHAVTLYTDVLGDGSGMDLARAVGRSILASHVTGSVQSRDLVQRCRNYRHAEKHERIAAMELLEAFDWVVAQDGVYEKGFTTTWAVNAQIHDLFKDHAEEQRLRRTRLSERLHMNDEAENVDEC